MLNLKEIQIDRNVKIAVAISGGRDSMFLFHNLLKEFNSNQITAITVDHGLRPESGEEAETVGQIANDLGVNHITLTWEGEKPESNVQEHARNMRYQMMLEFCELNEIKYLFVGHNLDDQAETVFYRIYRGTGVSGLTGIHHIEMRNGVYLVRPMLEITRAQITEYMQKHKFYYFDDPSNKSEKYERVKIRKFLNDHYDPETLKSRLCLLAKNSSRVDSFISEELANFMEQSVTIHPGGYMFIPYNYFNEHHEELRFRIISKIVMIFSALFHPPRLDSIKSIDINIQNRKNCVIGGVEFLINEREIIAIREHEALNSELKDNIWDNRFFVSGDLKDYQILPLNKSGMEQINIKIPAKIYKTIPAVYSSNGDFLACPLLDFNPYKLDIEFTCLFK